MNTTKDINQITHELRKRLSQFRYEHIGQEESIHINTIKIALGLVELAIRVDRKIRTNEVQWFSGGKEIDDILFNSSWRDISDLYYEMKAAAKNKNLFSKD